MVSLENKCSLFEDAATIPSRSYRSFLSDFVALYEASGRTRKLLRYMSVIRVCRQEFDMLYIQHVYQYGARLLLESTDAWFKFG